MASYHGKYELALEKFSESISLAESGSVYGEVGLAYERAAVVLKKCGKNDDSVLYMHKAIQAYENWGAFGKVAALKRIISTMVSVEGLTVKLKRYIRTSYPYE